MPNVRMKEEASGPVIGISAVIDGREAAMAKQKDRVEKMARMLAQFVGGRSIGTSTGGRRGWSWQTNSIRDAASAQRVGRQFRFAGVEVLVCYDDVWAYPGELEGLLLQNISAGPDTRRARVGQLRGVAGRRVQLRRDGHARAVGVLRPQDSGRPRREGRRADGVLRRAARPTSSTGFRRRRPSPTCGARRTRPSAATR